MHECDRVRQFSMLKGMLNEGQTPWSPVHECNRASKFSMLKGSLNEGQTPWSPVIL